MLDVKFKLLPGHTGERSWLEPAPLSVIYWNVTYACNFHCAICFADAGTGLPDELSTAEALRLVDQAADCGVKDIIVSGGEPFARPDLVEILARMGQRGVTARVATNGSLIDADLLKRLRDDTEVTSFQVSIDCLDPELYAALHDTEPAMLGHVLRTLKLMQKNGFHTTVSTRLAPTTLPGIPGLMDRSLQEGWSTLTVHVPVHTHRAEGAFAQDADALATLEPAFEHFARLPGKWLVETYIPWAQYHPLMVRLADKIRIIHRGCRAGRDRLAVHPDGTISPCVCMDVPQARLGNVRQDDLADVFENAPLCQLLRHPLEHGLCEDCPHVLTCGGGCRAAAVALTGRFDGQDLSCPVRQVRAALSGAAGRGR